MIRLAIVTGVGNLTRTDQLMRRDKKVKKDILNKNLSSRRKILRTIVGSGLIYPAVLLGQIRSPKKSNTTKPSHGSRYHVNSAVAGNSFESCMAGCEAQYYTCCDSVRRSRKSKAWKASIGYPGCMASWLACQSGCSALAIGTAISGAADWIANNPGAVVGTIVVIGGITFIVISTGPGAIALAPALAL